ncbi:MAG: response regulator transcription factor [Gallionella sp.]|nr:response regulator transcription factor [Gallionella sp.]
MGVRKLAVTVIEHSFVLQSGELLSRWVEAFPSAVAVAADGVGVSEELLLWVRIPQGQSPELLLGSIKRRVNVNTKLIALSDTPNDDEGLACLSAGASAYINTHATPEALRQVAEVVGQGGLWIGASLMQRLLRSSVALVATQPTTKNKLHVLTGREREVAEAVARGDSNKEIAKQLNITERTVKAHTASLFEKLGVRDRLQLALAVNAQRYL